MFHLHCPSMYHQAGSEKLRTPYPASRYPRNHVPCSFETMHFHQKFDKKSRITHECLKIKVKPSTFQHKKYLVFSLSIPRLYSKCKKRKLVKFKVVKFTQHTVYLTSELKRKTQTKVVVFVSLMLCYTEVHLVGIVPLL